MASLHMLLRCLTFVGVYLSVYLVAAQNEQVPIIDRPGPKRPNILFILTDDQDSAMGSLDYMPYLKKHIIDPGTSFNRHYCTVALCCPSRASLWTGKAAHNTNVTDVNPPHGGYPKFVAQGFNENYLPIWLQRAGYGTYYVGKLFNAQTTDNYDSPHAAGWTGSDFLLDPYTYRYLNATFQRNHDPPVSYENYYSTDVVAGKAHGFLEDALGELKTEGKPFFLTVAPMAPHSDVEIKQKIIHGNFSEHTSVQSPPIPAERHRHLFKGVTVPRTPHFNPDRPGGASWISRLPQQNETNVEFNDHFYRNRLRALQAVDEMIDSLVNRLEDAGVLDDTYVFFSTDNGYHIGQHRLQPGKQCAFEEDINIPLVVRGPGVPQGQRTEMVTTHTDLAPTFLSLAGVELSAEYGFDGQAIPIRDSSSVADKHSFTSQDWRQEHINVEMWGIIMSEGNYGNVLFRNHTYKALRVVGKEYSLLYTVWCSGEHELYNLKNDPYEMDNLYTADLSDLFEFDISSDEVGAGLHKPLHETEARSYLSDAETGSNADSDEPTSNHSTPLPEAMAKPYLDEFAASSRAGYEETRKLSHLVHRLDSLMMVLKTCKGRQCTHPWESLHPDGSVENLRDALHADFDSLYEHNYAHARVEYQKCETGYIAESEQPSWEGGAVYGMFDEVAFA